ncbi:GntR family transcriptional regulator [Nocardia sp. NBC_00511]|uniref:GntR family transcriptional regulator n=1 Tax=Nocardia sp. NBC_00511 TaxID=2903591 RepID=UPI0030E5F5A2
MAEPAYVSIAGDYARQIHTGALPPGTQLPSLAEVAERQGVSQIVVRQAVKLLLSQGLVRTVERRGTFVADRPDLVRLAPERQLETPETTFANESDREIRVDRDSERLSATDDLAALLGISPGKPIIHVVTRASEDGRPISISDSYQPLNVRDTSDAAFLEETIADRLPSPAHAAWLGTTAGDLVKAVHQRFLSTEERVLMVCDVSYPRDRYGAFVFRMALKSDECR